MAKKVLFVATVDSHIELFHLPYLKMFHDKGWEVHVATDTGKKIEYCDKKIKLPIKRSPFKLVSNYKAMRKLREVMKKEGYSIVHCHTPMGGVVARMAGRKLRRQGQRMIYTAHGFHFYKGAPVHYWLMFYPVEWYLAKYTDTLITINNEDYARAKKRFGKRCHDIQYVPGVGVDEKKFEKKMSIEEKHALRKSLGLKDDDKVLIFPAELSKRKNQIWLIKTLKPVFGKNKDMHLLLPGKDSLNGKCQKLALKLRVEQQVHFLGFRNDIPELLQISDIAVSSSRQEGLPVNLLEAAFRGLPIVATDCRGNRDVCEMVGKKVGVIVGRGDAEGIVKEMRKLAKENVASRNDECKKAIRKFDIKNVKDAMSKIYGLSGDLSLSIIIPVYNCEKYVGNCLESIVAQKDNHNLEIVIVNDGSTDDSEKICSCFADKYDCIRVYSQENAGVSNARNNGLKRALGDYVYFVDADDVLLPNCIEGIFRLMGRLPDVVSVGYKRITEHDMGKSTKEFNYKIVNGRSKILESLQRISLSQNVIKKDTIVANHLKMNENLKYTEDMDLMLEVLMRAKNVAVIDAELYGYRNNSSSATSAISMKRIIDMGYFIDKWSKYLSKLPSNEKDALGNFLAYQLLIMIGMMATLDNKKAPFKKYERLLIEYHNSFKTRIGYLCYVLFGINRTAQIMSSFLMSKKLLVKEDNE